MTKLVVAGLASAIGLGDAVQYCVMTKIVGEVIPKIDITLICPDAQELTSASTILHPSPRLLNSNLTGKLIIRQLFGSLAFDKLTDRSRKTTTLERANEGTLFRGDYAIAQGSKKLVANCCNSYSFGKYVASPIIKAMFSFDAGIIGGHTICCNLDDYTIQYITLRSAVRRGPIVTSPISLSSLSMDYYKNKDKTVLKRLKQSLEELDFIYVRGSYSLGILKDELNINDKVAIALDSGFGLNLIYPDVLLTQVSKERPLRIIIIPRREFFDCFNKIELYKLYLESLVGLIQWLFKKYNADVYLALQIMDNCVGRRLSGIEDLVKLLEKRTQGNQSSRHLKIFQPTNILDAFKFYGSSDVVISSYMHGGIIALSAGVPSVFVAPLTDVKILDTLATLSLDPDNFLIDMFDPTSLTAKNFIDKTRNIIEDLDFYKKTVKKAVNSVLPTIDLPAKMLVRLIE